MYVYKFLLKEFYLELPDELTHLLSSHEKRNFDIKMKTRQRGKDPFFIVVQGVKMIVLKG